MVKIKELKAGERVSMTDYFTVKSVHEDAIVVEDSTGQEITFEGKALVENKLISNSQYNETIKCGKHELVDILNNAKDKIFTVAFTKANGDERILTGHLFSVEPNLGRTNVIDLEVAHGSHNHRQVDNRTISWLVLDNIRYNAQ